MRRRLDRDVGMLHLRLEVIANPSSDVVTRRLRDTIVDHLPIRDKLCSMLRTNEAQANILDGAAPLANAGSFAKDSCRGREPSTLFETSGHICRIMPRWIRIVHQLGSEP
jgi:hypothetical protein